MFNQQRRWLWRSSRERGRMMMKGREQHPRLSRESSDGQHWVDENTSVYTGNIAHQPNTIGNSFPVYPKRPLDTSSRTIGHRQLLSTCISTGPASLLSCPSCPSVLGSHTHSGTAEMMLGVGAYSQSK